MAGGSIINLTDESQLGLKTEPAKTIIPKAFRITGKQDGSPRTGDTHRFFNHSPLVHLKGRETVLNTDDDIKWLVPEPKKSCVHLENLAGRILSHLFSQKTQAGIRNINTYDGFSFFQYFLENSTVSAAELEH